MALNPAQVIQGPFLIGVIFNIALYGIMISQTFLYFTTYKNDPRWMKIFVTFLMIADTLNSIFVLVYVYDCLVNHFGDAGYLANVTVIFATDPALNGIIGGAVQLFFAWRVHVVSKNIFAVGAIVICSAANLLSAIGTAIGARIIQEFQNLQKLQVIVIIWLSSAAVADVLIATALVWHLSQRKTGFSTTDDIINRIMRLTVQTGLITAVCAVVDLICYLTIPTGIHFIFNVPLAKLYSNSLMSSLNYRGGWKLSQHSENSSNHANSARRATDVVQLQNFARPEVHVHVESHHASDEDTKLDAFNRIEAQDRGWRANASVV